MAYFGPGETPTDEPFKQHLTPLEVATAVQSGLSALWLGAPREGRSLHALADAAKRAFEEVELWWLNLPDRSGVAIVAASQAAFGPPQSAQEQANAGTLKRETMAAWLPRHSFAEALFWAWLLQPEQERTPVGTAKLVRQILDRQLRTATEDIATFAPSNGSGGPAAA
jgi:hypothetical protein